MKTQKIFKGSPVYFNVIEGENITGVRPLYTMMNLDTRCGYGCRFCALGGKQRIKGTPLTSSQRKNIIQKLASIGTRALVIIGEGEPTQDFAKVQPVIQAAHSEGMITIFFTTLAGLDEEQAKFCHQHGCSIFVTLHSLKPSVYQFLTGCGDLKKVLVNFQILQNVYCQRQEQVVRLGINMPLFKQNATEVKDVKSFANNAFFVANAPMGIGRAENPVAWELLVGNEYETLVQLGHENSQTGGPSSIFSGRCGYNYLGITVDIDGELITCGYASQTNVFGNAQSMNAADLLAHFQKKQQLHQTFEQQHNRMVPCPPRDNMEFFTEFLRNH